MANVTARILTALTPIMAKPELGVANETHPKIVDDYTPIRFRNIEGMPVARLPIDANVWVVEGVWTVEQFAAILSDPNYGPSAVIWDSVSGGSSQKIDQSHITALGQLLLSRHGIPVSVVQAAKNALKVGDTRAQLCARLVSWLASRPKAN